MIKFGMYSDCVMYWESHVVECCGVETILGIAKEPVINDRAHIALRCKTCGEIHTFNTSNNSGILEGNMEIEEIEDRD